MSDTNGYKHLSKREGSAFKQLFVSGRRVPAGVLWGLMKSGEYQTPEEMAADFDLALEAVVEALHYCENNPHVLEEDWQAEEATIRELRLDQPPLVPADFEPGGE